jgi:hypothetical protein
MYGFPITWQTSGDLSTNGKQSGAHVVALNPSGVESHFVVLKPHGSLNWLVPIEGHYDKSKNDDLRKGKSVIVALGENGALHYPPYHPRPSGDLLGCEVVRLPPELSGDVVGATMETEPVIVTPRGAKKLNRQFLFLTRRKGKAKGGDSNGGRGVHPGLEYPGDRRRPGMPDPYNGRRTN